MISVSVILQRQEPWGTLATFAQLRPQTHMPRQHISLPDQMLREVEDICARNMWAKSKFIRKGVQMALDDARKRFGEASNDPVAAPAPPPAPLPSFVAAEALQPAVEASAPADEVATLLRGSTTWFDMHAVCAKLGVTTEALLEEIDPEDDVLTYAGKAWIDATGIAEARSLCRDTTVSDDFGAWVQTKSISTL